MRRDIGKLRNVLGIGSLFVAWLILLTISPAQAALETCPVGVGTTPVGWTLSSGSRGGGVPATGVFDPGTGLATVCYLITDYTSPPPADPTSGNFGDTASTFMPSTNIISGTTNASRLTSPAFTAAAGQQIDFSFMFATTDGAGFSDWARASLIDSKGNSVVDLFTARTGTSGQVVPGFGFPSFPPGLVLTPSKASLQGNIFNLDGVRFGPFRYPEYFNTTSTLLGGSAPWVDALYTFSDATAGTYQLEMTAANFSDEAYASALIFGGESITSGVIVPPPGPPGTSVPEPPTAFLLGPTLLGVLGISWVGRRKVAHTQNGTR